MEDKKRMAGGYEIIQAFHIGDREIVLGEDMNANPEERYMCAYCQQSEIAALYNEVIVSDDYCEAVKLFASRLSKQAEKTRVEVFSPKFQGIDMTPLTSTDCTPRPAITAHGWKNRCHPSGCTAEGVSVGNPSAEALYRRLWSQSPQPGFCLFLYRFMLRKRFPV